MRMEIAIVFAHILGHSSAHTCRPAPYILLWFYYKRV